MTNEIRKELNDATRLYNAKKRAVRRARRVESSSKNETTPIRMTYDNGIAVGEGMSVTGTKQRRGAHRPFLYKY